MFLQVEFVRQERDPREGPQHPRAVVQGGADAVLRVPGVQRLSVVQVCCFL